MALSSVHPAPPTVASVLVTLPRTLAAIFTWRRLPWHLLAIAVTAGAVLSGFDWWYSVRTRSVPDLLYFPAVVMGGLLPVLVPVTLLVVGSVRKQASLRRMAFALGQAAIAAVLVSSAYKAVTGRIEPPIDLSAADNSHDFNFGLWEHGVFWGWPSGHTMTACAMAVTLIALVPLSKAVRVFAPIYALYIGLSVSISIHWFSDFAAGAIIGAVVGVATAATWRRA